MTVRFSEEKNKLNQKIILNYKQKLITLNVRIKFPNIRNQQYTDVMDRVQSDRSNGYFFIWKNYLYTKDRKQNDTTFFSCHKKRYHNCMGRATWKLGFEPIITRQHNHDSEEEKVKILRFKEILRRRASTELLKSPAVIFNEEKQNFCEEAEAMGGFSKKLENMMQRARKNNFPAIPTNYEDIHNALSDKKYQHLSTELGPDESQFYGDFIPFNDTEDIIYFISPIIKRELINLANYRLGGLRLHIDGSFRFIPKEGIPINLFIINIIYKNEIFPLIYAFLQKKTEGTYKRILGRLKHILIINKKTLPISLVITDYDNMLRIAIRAIFTDVRITGCWFYFCKNLHLKAREIGLLSTTSSNISFIKILKMAMSLPHLPTNWVNRGVEIIEQYLDGEANDMEEIAMGCRFIQYLRSQWIVQEISIYKSSMKINGSVDAFHAEFYRLLLRGYSNLWTFLIALQKKEFSKGCKLINLQNGKPITTEIGKNSYKKLTQNIQHLQNSLDFHQLNIEQFLCKMFEIMENLEYSWNPQDSPATDPTTDVEILLVIIDDKIENEIDDNNDNKTEDNNLEIIEDDIEIHKSDLEQSLDLPKTINFCKICNERLSESAFIPCGHRCVCENCGDNLNQKKIMTCPICGSTASFITKIIL